MYFIQQSEATDTGEEGGWDPEEPVVDLPEEPVGSVSVFSLIGPDGKVALASDFPELADPAVLAEIRNRLPVSYAFTSEATRSKLIRSKFSSSNVPALWFEDGTWQSGDNSKNEMINNGPDTTAGSNSISSVVYYSYNGANPFFSLTNSYNSGSYNKEGSRKMERFVFYRFIGKPPFVAPVDNMLVAVDTYTRLYFAFGKPTAYKSILGHSVPTDWGPVESTSTDSEGKPHPFYEYDPAGYIDETGKFINADWYALNMAAGNYDPRYTGLSPYSVKTGTVVKFTPVISASLLADGILQEPEGRYYTKITTTPQAQSATYHLYRLDDRGAQWLKVGNPVKAASGEAIEFRDHDALFLTKLPRYKVEAYSDTGDLFGTSEEVEGSRMLTSREALLAAMETIRFSCTELWYKSGSLGGGLSKGSTNGLTGRYDHGIDRNGFFGTNYRRYQAYENYSNSLVNLNGTFMKDNGGGAIGLDKHGLWTHSGSNWPASGEFPARTDSLAISWEGQQWELIFNEINIDNNDGDAPDWLTGSFTVRRGSEEFIYGKNDVPFALFMSEATFRSSLGGADYTQK